MNDTTTPRMVDEVADNAGNRHELTQIYKIGTDIVRVRVRRDLYPDRSFAVAEVLTSDRRWSQLIDAPTWAWFDQVVVVDCPDYATDTGTGLSVVADLLYERAAAILT